MFHLLFFFQVFLATILVFSGISKLFSIDSFIETIKKIGIHKKLTKPLATIISVSEILVGVLFFDQRWVRVTSFVTVFLFSVFLLVTIISIYKKADINCNCFGVISNEKLGYITLIKILLIICLDTILIVNDYSINILTIQFGDILHTVLTSVGIIIIYSLISNIVSLNKIKNIS